MLKYTVQFILVFTFFLSSLFISSGKISYSYNLKNHTSVHLAVTEKTPNAYIFPFLLSKQENKLDRVFNIDQLSGFNGTDIYKDFTAIPAYNTSLHPTAVVIEDFNGDGKKDLAVSHFGAVTSMTVL